MRAGGLAGGAAKAPRAEARSRSWLARSRSGWPGAGHGWPGPLRAARQGGVRQHAGRPRGSGRAGPHGSASPRSFRPAARVGRRPAPRCACAVSPARPRARGTRALSWAVSAPARRVTLAPPRAQVFSEKPEIRQQREVRSPPQTHTRPHPHARIPRTRRTRPCRGWLRRSRRAPQQKTAGRAGSVPQTPYGEEGGGGAGSGAGRIRCAGARAAVLRAQRRLTLSTGLASRAI